MKTVQLDRSFYLGDYEIEVELDEVKIEGFTSAVSSFEWAKYSSVDPHVRPENDQLEKELIDYLGLELEDKITHKYNMEELDDLKKEFGISLGFYNSDSDSDSEHELTFLCKLDQDIVANAKSINCKIQFISRNEIEDSRVDW